jgi:small subunit ribosomal protein S20
MAQGTAVKHRKKTKSVLKNIRQAASRAAINRMNRTRVRGAMRRMRAALSSGNTGDAEKLASATYSELDKAIRKRTLTENTANRYKSRLSLALNALKAKKAKS